MRRSLPNRLIATGMSKPGTFSNSSALFFSRGPFITRSAISVISKSRLTGSVMRARSRVLSRCRMNSRRFANAIAVAGLTHHLAAIYVDGLPGQIARRVTTQKDHQPHHIIRLAQPRLRNVFHPLAHHLLVLAQVRRHLGDDDARTNGVDANVVSGELAGTLAGEAHQPGLAGDVSRPVAQPKRPPGDGANVDDGPAALGLHHAPSGLTGEKWTAEVHVQRAPPII